MTADEFAAAMNAAVVYPDMAIQSDDRPGRWGATPDRGWYNPLDWIEDRP